MATALTPRVDLLEKKTDEHDEWINGNGKQGAKVTLALLDERTKQIVSKLERFEKMLWAIIVSFMLSAAGFIWLVVVHKITVIMP